MIFCPPVESLFRLKAVSHAFSGCYAHPDVVPQLVHL